LDDRALVDAALSGDSAATRALVHRVMPVVQARVARILVRRRGGSGRDVRQEVEDLAQEVFAALFENDGRVLRAWDPARGLALPGFCGLIAEREAAAILRSGKRSPWTESATEMEALERALPSAQAAEAALASREQIALLVERLRETLSPLGLEMFQRLVVEEQAVDAVCKATGMTPDAVYAWKSRIGKLLRKIMSEEEPEERRAREETS
jgi:RNA polymerase sigma-70 factor (ECF subfamily)